MHRTPFAPPNAVEAPNETEPAAGETVTPLAGAMTVRPSAVRMQQICKRFGAVQANREISLGVAKGAVHGIVGENGAGKSTLMGILCGLLQPDQGQIAIDGQTVEIADTAAAIALGIGMVHQHFMLVECFSAIDNILLGAAPHWLLDQARAQVREPLERLMQDTGLQVRLDAPVAELPVGERQRLEILKVLFRGAKILILDEPTAVLTPQETDQLFITLRKLCDSGTTVLLISHKLKEILALCDHVTVLRAGTVAFDGPTSQCDVDQLAQAMVGRRVRLGRSADQAASDRGLAAPTQAQAPLLCANDLGWRDAAGVSRVLGVSLTLRPGEIVGIAGVAGNGQSELLAMLSGIQAAHSGSLQLGNETFAPERWLDPATARRLGLAHVPEDRHHYGMVLGFAAWETAVLGYQGNANFTRKGIWMRRRAVRQATTQMFQAYDVRPPNIDLRSAQLSGGNQQKLVLAREALAPQTPPRVLLVGQPTRGVDIGAIEFIHGRLRAMRDAGGAVLLVSSELDEILALADRVLVMHQGTIAGALPIAECSESALGRLMAGIHDEAPIGTPFAGAQNNPLGATWAPANRPAI